MANVKITELTELAAADLADGDVFPIVDVGADTTKKVTAASVRQTLAYANDYATFTFIDANLNTVSGNADAYYTQLNANINVVQDNVATNVTDITALETRRSDNVFYTLNLTGAAHANVIINDANVEPTSNNTYSLGAPDKVWKELYLGPNSLKLGKITISDLGGEGITITGASGEQANVTTPNQGGVANISAEINTLQANINTVQDNVASVTVGTAADTETRLNANLNVVSGNADAFYAQLNANINVVQDNVATVSVGTASDTETRLNANLDIVSDNAAAVETRRSANTFFVYNNSIHANVEITAANVLSSANNTFSLGAPDKQWKDVYIGPGSLYVNNKQVIQDDSGTITIKTDVNEDLKIETSGTGSLTLSTGGGSGAILLSGSVGVASGSISIDDPINMNTNRITGLAAPAAGTDAVRQTDLDEVQSNLSTTVTTVDAFGTYANTNFDTRANASSTYSSLSTDIDTVQSNVTAVETRRVANIAGAVSSVLTSDLTVSRALASDGSGKIAVSDVTATELGYLDGVTSAIQTQLNAIESRRSANNITTTFSDDVTITGNLTINGDTTTVSSTNMLVEDALIELQNGLTGSNSNDVGVIFERGTTGDNGMFFWDESEDEFAFATGTETGASTGSLTIGSYADIAVKNITVSGTVDGIDIATNAAALATADAALETRRAANIAGAVSTITTGNLTASRALASDGSGKVAVSDVTSTELSYLDGVTSAIQTQIDAKLASASYTAADVLTKLLTVDGTGSALDADLLDGQHANYYAVETTRSANAAELASGIASAVAGSGISGFSLEDGGAGTSVEMGDGQRVKFNEGGGVDITFTDTSPGSVADPYDLTFTIDTSVIAGSGLTGGGQLNADRTLNIGAGTGVTVNADSIEIGQDVATTASPTFAGLTVTTFDLGALT